MGWRYRRSRKIGPVRLNFGKTGLTSVSAGTRIARVTFSKRGAYRTITIPRTGLSHVRKLTPEEEADAVGALAALPLLAGAGAILLLILVITHLM